MTTTPKQVPLLVTVTYTHVVWLDLPDDETPQEFAELWREEPGEMFDRVPPDRADDVHIDITYDPGDPLVLHQGFIGPTFPSGAWSRAEDDRYQEHVRRMESAR